jgi:hypothetical protein
LRIRDIFRHKRHGAGRDFRAAHVGVVNDDPMIQAPLASTATRGPWASVCSAAEVTMNAKNAVRDEFATKIQRGIFKPVARHLRAEIVEDRMQEGIAQMFQTYRRYIEDKNIVLPDAILVHGCGLRSRDLSRHLAAGTHSARDAMDERNRLDGRVEVVHLEGIFEEDSGQGDRALAIGLADAGAPNPAARLHSAIDLQAWLAGLDDDDRRLLELRATGFKIGECAASVGVTHSLAGQRLRRLGQALAIQMACQ